VTDNAIYKLTYEDIRQMGFADPAKTRLYGCGGWALEQDFTKPFPDDLPEVAAYVHRGADGVFGAGDFVLFYGRGVVKWSYDAGRDCFVHQNNPYANAGYYFITEHEQGFREMAVQEAPVQAGDTVVRTFDDYRVHERDWMSILHSGRELFGESFVGRPSQNFTFNLPGITAEAGRVYLSFAAAVGTTTPVTLSIGNETLIQAPIQPIPASGYEKAKKEDRIVAWAGEKPETVTVNVSFQSTTSTANLNFINLNMRRRLRAYENEAYTFFRHKDNRRKALQYRIENAAGRQVWNLTDAGDVRQVQTQQEAGDLLFGRTAGGVPEYALVDVSRSFPSPKVVGEVKNQNLHALPQVDMVIIVPEPFFALAERLAEAHRQRQGLTVAVVQPEWIYNEFSSGTPDATAYRRFLKMFYDRATTAAEKPRYLLLYGDAYFDNRRLTKEGAELNGKYYLLSFQVENSVNETYSYGTDDYFGFLDDWEGVNLGVSNLDIGIGRFPVNTIEQAEIVLNKTLRYMENTRHSAWKNTVIFTADDTDAVFGYCGFAKDADELARIVEDNCPSYVVMKSYMDAFRPMTVNGKRTYPDARQKLMRTLEEGCFLFNYTGHGNPTSMSAEDMMNINTIRQMNFENLPLWITATCDFGRFDDIKRSSGEEVMLNKKSAGIALITTTRVVYGAPNHDLNRSIIRKLFATTDGKHPTLGDVMRESKRDHANDSNKLNFVLLGDPALQLNYPEQEIAIESINDQPVEAFTPIRALEAVTLKGVVKDGQGQRVENFNGTLAATIFDGQQTLRALAAPLADNDFWSFDDYPNVVYKGTVPVENGAFSLSFRVPRDISHTDRPGKMNFYAWDATNQTDATGFFKKYALSGTATDVPLNEIGPEIEALYLNSADFRNGDKVNETPFFYASVFDEDGINRTGGGVGHNITLCIDNQPARRYDLNNYFTPGREYGHGSIGFPIPELPAGPHTLVFKVWDILNNPTTDSLHFTVVKGIQPALSDVRTAPNPARERTVFYLSHNRPESVLEVELRVYDLTGRIIWTHAETSRSAQAIEWNLVGDNGSRVAPGVYVYQAVIRTPGGKETTLSKKLIVL
jgi:hypothetical protein